ncbi:hypothetical protein [Bacillus haynesii]|uniref:hypothetical protein n=1 Tax=Bacillus haynesii TaxID=1925021 RepID=UPI002DBE49C4|nr:hypothetical protein [Bacillus haynesii]MEC1476525.1 hypothetical protein [Bacillus haynesii]
MVRYNVEKERLDLDENMGIEKNVPVLSCAAFFRLQSGPLHVNKVLIAYQREMGFSIEKRDVSNDDRPDQDQDQVLLIKEGDEYDFKNAGAAVLRGDFHIGQNERG